MYSSRVTLGEKFNFTPCIIEARAILAIPDTSKRKSEWRVIDPGNKTELTNPEIEPRIFLECYVVGEYWGTGPNSLVIDIENNELYKNVTGSSYKNGKSEYRQYLKSVHPRDQYIKVEEIVNLQEVIEAILGEEVSTV